MKKSGIVHFTIAMLASALLAGNMNAQMAELLTTNTDICDIENIEIKIKFTGTPPFDARIRVTNQETGAFIGTHHLVENFTPGPDGIATRNLPFPVTQPGNPRINKIRIVILDAKDNANVWTTNVQGEAVITSYIMPTPNAGVDAESCGYSIRLTATPSPQSTTINWQSTTGIFLDPTDPRTTFIATDVNSYNLTFTETNGPCRVSDAVTVNLLGSPSAHVSTTSKICETGSATLNLSLEGSGPWNIRYTDGTTTRDLANITNPNYSWTITGLVGETTFSLVRLTDNNGCTAATNQLTGQARVINLKPSPNAGPDNVACGLVYTMQALPGVGLGTWSGSTGISYSPSNSPTATITATNFGEQTFTWTLDNESCVAQDQVTIRFVELPSVSIASSTQSVCEGSAGQVSLSLTGSPPWRVSYLSGTTPDNISIPISPAAISLTPVTSTTYQITKVTDTHGCFTNYPNMSFTIGVDKRPTPNAGNDIDFCGSGINLSAVSSIGTGQWSGPGSFANNSIPGTSYTNSAFGTHTLRWTETNGVCSAWDDVKVTFFEAPTSVDAGPDQTLYLSYETRMAALPPLVGQGNWSVTRGVGNIVSANSHDSDITGLETGSASFRWTVSNGNCPSLFDDVQIDVQGLQHVTGFSPNGDGINDYFEIKGGSFISNNELIVFNHAGEVVYRETNYLNTWTGTGMDERPLPDGIYYFVFSGAGIKPIKDFLVIKRSTR